MKFRKTSYSLLLGLLSIAGCGEIDDGVGTQTGDIIRATSNGGRDQVVMLYGVLTNGSRESLLGLLLRAARGRDRRPLLARRTPIRCSSTMETTSSRTSRS